MIEQRIEQKTERIVEVELLRGECRDRVQAVVFAYKHGIGGRPS